MALEQPWMLAVVGGLALLAIAAGIVLGLGVVRRRGVASGAPVARAERVRSLPSVRRAILRQVAVLAGVCALAAVGVASAALVAARPMEERIVEPETRSRDVMLCLDVSGSMTDVDAEVVELFGALADDFAGERVGLTIFNSSPVQIFPLTDDYAFVQDHLASLRDSFDYVDEVPEHWVGTLDGDGASLVGDGLAACALGFDHADEKRARSIILATDNEVNGAETVSLADAASYTSGLGVRVFTIDPAEAETEASTALREATESTGGAYFGLHDATTVDEIVGQVRAEDATILTGEPRIVRVDAPGYWVVIVAVAALALVLVVGRVRS